MPLLVLAAAATIALAQPFHVKLTGIDSDGDRIEMMSTEGFADRGACEEVAAQERADLEQIHRRIGEEGAAADESITVACVAKDGHPT